jgi:hypothetical protein
MKDAKSMRFDSTRLTARYRANTVSIARTATVLQTEAVRTSRLLATASVYARFPRTIWASSDSPTVTQIADGRQLFECARLYWKYYLLKLDLRNRLQLSIRELYLESFISFITTDIAGNTLFNTDNPPEHLSLADHLAHSSTEFAFVLR